MADQYEGFSRKDLIKMLEEANDSVEHYEKLCEEKDAEYEKMVEEKNEEISELDELRSMNTAIMEEPETSHILGCDAYEKFCQAICELNYDEKWIGDLKKEVAELKIEKVCLLDFLSGNYNSEPAVKDIIKREYSQDFIDSNGERWAEIGIEW